MSVKMALMKQCYGVLSMTTEQQCCLNQMFKANKWELHLKSKLFFSSIGHKGAYAMEWRP